MLGRLPVVRDSARHDNANPLEMPPLYLLMILGAGDQECGTWIEICSLN